MGHESQTKETRAKETLLVVDDDESVRRGLYWTLNSDYRVLESASREEAVKLLQQESIDLVLSDLH
jgi:response regulator RpfG family c-di-GMP phosphodiesterase